MEEHTHGRTIHIEGRTHGETYNGGKINMKKQPQKNIHTEVTPLGGDIAQRGHHTEGAYTRGEHGGDIRTEGTYIWS